MRAFQKVWDENQSEEMIPALCLASLQDEVVSTEPTSFMQALEDTGLQDVISPRAAHGGMVQHIMEAGRPVLWVQDHASRMEFGAPAMRGQNTLYAPTRNARDTLWAMEEAVKAGVNVVGEIMGMPRALDFTATRRLELFSRAAGVRCILVRTGAQAETGGSSGARWRWRVEAVESELHPFDTRAPGRARWSLELLRARSRPPGRWVVETDDDEARDSAASHRLRLVPSLAAGDMVAREPQREAGQNAFRRRAGYGTGNVIALR